ncbi:hypothetical protein ACO0LF_17615 [Undibacterium sp. Di27W]|uniref:hypothetical protein n=1 Tax=Undibacterium sp. Di27W TaxID=3413036 RepID=UPI003BF14F39
MAAKQITVFFPLSVDKDRIIANLVKNLSLEIDCLPDDFPCEFSAQRGRGPSYVLIEYQGNDRGEIEELSQWERPSENYKKLLLQCKSKILLHYRDANQARKFFLALATTLETVSSRCIVENGFGCLLLLSEIVTSLEHNKAWTWERDVFPDLPDVAVSEWTDDLDDCNPKYSS